MYISLFIFRLYSNFLTQYVLFILKLLLVTLIYSVVLNFFSNTNILYCFHGALELTPYVSHKIRLSL
jgi:hypothetical protein